VDSQKASGTPGRVEGPNLGYKPRYKEGYFPVPTMDSQQDIRSEMVLLMEEVGIYVETHHHEWPGRAGGNRYAFRFPGEYGG